MTYLANVVRMTHHFDLGSVSGTTGDIAEFNTWWHLDPGDLPSDWDALLLDLATTGEAAWHDNAPTGKFGGYCYLTAVKCSSVNTAGITQHQQVFVPATAWHGTATVSLPFQISMAVGLYTYTPGTFIANARQRRGRIFLPPFAASAIDDVDRGMLTNTAVDDVLSWVNDMFDDVTSHVLAGTSHAPAAGVLSREASHFYTLTDFASDGVLDSQRRRTKQLSRARRAKQFTG